MLMMELWSDILERFEKVSQTLQKVDTSLERFVGLYESLVSFIETLRKSSLCMSRNLRNNAISTMKHPATNAKERGNLSTMKVKNRKLFSKGKISLE